jgi:hypothetical protein
MPNPENESGLAQEAGQLAAHPVAAGDAAVARVTTRLTIQFYMRFTKLITDMAGGDLVGAIVLHAIMAANAGSGDDNPATAGRYPSLETIPPDSERRPVSVLAVAGSLGMPYETTRQHVNRLVKEGRCVKVKGGVIFPASRVGTPASNAAIMTNMANVRRFYRALKRAGVELD